MKAVKHEYKSPSEAGGSKISYFIKMLENDRFQETA